MKKILGYTVSVFIIIAVLLVCQTVFFAAGPTLSVNKTAFTVGEDIVVSFSDLDASAYSSSSAIELRIYKEGETPGVHASTDYVVIHSSTVDLGSNGTITLPKDGARTNVTSYAAGNYKIMLLHGSTSICDPVSITITGDITLTTNKSKYEVGEKITVSYSNVAASLAGNQDIEVRLYKDGDIPGTHASTDYYRIYTSSMGINKTHSGSITFPDDGARNLSTINPGKYKVMLLRANTQMCDPVTISIGEPVLNLNKSVYAIGESISVSYKNAYASHDKGQGVEIRIYKVGDTPGVIASQDYYVLQNKTSGISRPETGTIVFPTDGGRNKEKYDAGDYEIMVLYANTPISEKISFKIVDSIIFSTDKTEYAPGDPIKVTYGNVVKEYDKGNGIEIRIYKQGDTPGVIASQDYVILHNTSKGIDLLSSGVVTFPDNGARNKTDYISGTYEVMLLQGNTPICDPIVIKINAPQPQISVSKNHYKPGEVIKVNYSDVSKAYDAGMGLEIRIYKQGDTPGVIASQDYVILYNPNQGIDKLDSGVLSFPGDGARGKTDYAPGTYVVMLVHGNTPVIDEITFTVTDNPPTGDNGMIFAFVILISISAVLIVKKKQFNV